jgi:hypothetical protein
MSHNDLINSTAESFIEQLDELFSDSKNTKGYQKRKDDIIELFKEAINNAIEEVEKESKTKTKKSKTGTGKKRGPSGYNIFIKKRMPELKNFSDAAAEWKTMTKEQKQPFNDDAKQRKTTDDEQEEETTDTEKKKSDNKKKRAPSGYNLFMREQNTIYKQKGEKGNHMKDIATTWKALSDEKKKTYNDKAKTQTTDSEQKSKTESDNDVNMTSEDEKDTKTEDSKTKTKKTKKDSTKKPKSKQPSKKTRKNESSDDE